MLGLPKFSRWAVCGLLLALSAFWCDTTVRANHGHHVTIYGGVYGPGYFVYPNCVTNWYGYPIVGPVFGGGFYGGYSSYGYSNYGYSSWSPFFGPTVIQQTTVVPVSPTVVVTVPQTVVARSTRRVLPPPPPQDGSNMNDILRQHAERREGIPSEVDVASTVRPVSASSRAGKERSQQFQAEGDRLLHDGQFVKAYLRYLEAQREAEDRGDVYFRQAFTLVALGRHSHAVMKLKRGLQVDLSWPKHATSLDAVYGVENVVQKVEYLQRVADWTNANVRDSDRLFLMGVMLFCDDDSRATEFFRGASKLSGGQGLHLQAFLNPSDRQTPPSPPREAVAEGKRALPPPPLPQDDLGGVNAPVEPVAGRLKPLPNARGPRLPALDAVPPAPARRELILPDVLDPNAEYVP